jgi:hypothetical protein
MVMPKSNDKRRQREIDDIVDSIFQIYSVWDVENKNGVVRVMTKEKFSQAIDMMLKKIREHDLLETA